MTVIADDDVRRLVSRTGLDRTLFVEAGAGTGKTTQLVDRIANLVLERDIRLADIAAITFTEAAAAELQDRIRVRFEEEAADTTDDEVRRRCRQAVADADLAAISTLHGFAKRVLSEHPVAAGLPPRVDILDEVSSQLAHEARWERFVDRLYQDPANEELLARAALLDVALEPRYHGQPTMKDVAAALAQSWDRLAPVADRPLGPLPDIDLGPFRRAVAELERVVATCTDPDDKLYANLCANVVPAMRRIAGLAEAGRALRALVAVMPRGWTAGVGGRKAAWGCDVADVRQYVKDVNAAGQDILARVADDVLHRLLTLVAGEVLAAAEARRLEGRLEFHDLLVLARRLLRTSPGARQALHRRYPRLLLDEFQDTDPIQIELAVLIAAAVDGREPSAWDAMPVEEGRLFFVGDPKQSIYRFRRADIGLFLRARDRFAGDGCQRLTTNFRTVPDVVTWVNGLFSTLMADEVPGAQPRYEPLVAHRRAASGADHRPLLLGGPTQGDVRRKADDLRQAEAADVARTIDDIWRHPERWPVDDGAGGWRPARLPDVTVLVPTRTSLPHLREALAERDIPYRLDTGTLVYSTQEVRDALAALRAIDDPGDARNLVTALRSPLYACSDPDLFTWRAAGGRWEVTAGRPDAIAQDHPVAAGLAHLRSLWEQRWWLTPSDLLDRLLVERQAHLLAFGHERPAEVWRRLRFLVDQARSFEESGGSSVRAFLDWADLQGSEGARVHDPLLPETDDAAVRIMTVHGSKGLEFPITILSGTTTQNRRIQRGFSLLWDDDGLPQLKFGRNASTELHDPRADIEAEMDAHEKLRLLYVACTRARDHLVVGCHHNPSEDSYARQVWTTCQELPGSWRALPGVEPVATTPVQGSLDLPPPLDDDAEGWRAGREALLAPQRRPRVVSATTIAAEAGLVPAPDVDPGLDPDDDSATPSDGVGPGDGSATATIRRRGRAGTAIGRAVHATLQVLDLADPGDVDEKAAHQAEIEAVPEAAATVAAMVRSALASDAVRHAVAARHHKEVYVAAPVGDRVVEGYVDLLVETADGLVVVDYKTDAVASEADVDAKLATYELQGATYAVALEASTGLPVTGCRFVFCRPAGAIERDVVDLAAATDRVRRHLQA